MLRRPESILQRAGSPWSDSVAKIDTRFLSGILVKKTGYASQPPAVTDLALLRRKAVQTATDTLTVCREHTQQGNIFRRLDSRMLRTAFQ